MLKHPLGEREESWEYFDESTTGTDSILSFTFISNSFFAIPARGTMPVNRFEIPVDLLEGGKEISCEYVTTTLSDGRKSTGRTEIRFPHRCLASQS